MKNKYLILNLLVLLVIVEVVLTGFLSYKAVTSVDGFCVMGEDASQCDNVQNSGYGKIFGVKLGYFGLTSFLVLSAVLFRDFHKKKISNLFIGLSIIGAIFALYFVYLQIFVLKQICETCMIVDGTAVLILLVCLAGKKAPLV
ncbi:MAG: hypothetical protein KKE05_03125 [Nanoarchaeota archaeon]|nr:hypothetical protein [Nanoarchaeota archaeon]